MLAPTPPESKPRGPFARPGSLRTRRPICASTLASPLHKRNPGDFGLTPPASPRPDKTLCDEADVFARAAAADLLSKAIDGGLTSEAFNGTGFPKQLWVVSEGRVFEAMQGGNGAYHGYPIRRTDPFYDEVLRRWNEQ